MKSNIRSLSTLDAIWRVVRMGRVLAMATVVTPSVTFGAKVVLDEVPAYDWYHGCAPTAAASVFGYWDLNGFVNLFDASGWDAIRWTGNVQDQISSPAHNAKYDPYPDDPSLPVPPDTSIADFMGTSEGSLGFGYTYAFRTGVGPYAAYRGYQFDCGFHGWGEDLGQVLMAEIAAGRPMLFSVDSNGDSRGDHVVPVLGFDDRGADGLWYGFYSTWNEEETTYWALLSRMTRGSQWGVGAMYHVRPEGGFPAVPEPDSSAAGLVIVISSVGFASLRQLPGRGVRR